MALMKSYKHKKSKMNKKEVEELIYFMLYIFVIVFSILMILK